MLRFFACRDQNIDTERHSSCCSKCYRTHLERGITSFIKKHYWQPIALSFCCQETMLVWQLEWSDSEDARKTSDPVGDKTLTTAVCPGGSLEIQRGEPQLETRGFDKTSPTLVIAVTLRLQLRLVLSRDLLQLDSRILWAVLVFPTRAVCSPRITLLDLHHNVCRKVQITKLVNVHIPPDSPLISSIPSRNTIPAPWICALLLTEG
jgi:hypothetical protein